MSKLSNAFKSLSAPLRQGEIVRIKQQNERIPLLYYFKKKLGIHPVKMGKYYLAHCPSKNYNADTRIGDENQMELAIYPDRNVSVCYGNKCQRYNKRDVFDWHYQLFFPKDKRGALEDLEEFFVSEVRLGPLGKKWDKTKVNWGTPKHPTQSQREKTAGDNEKLAEVLTKESVWTEQRILKHSPFDVVNTDLGELAWEIHTTLWLPGELRCLQKTQKDTLPLIVTEEQLRKFFSWSNRSLLDYTYGWHYPSSDSPVNQVRKRRERERKLKAIRKRRNMTMNGQVKLKVNLILNGEFHRAGKVLHSEKIPLRFRKGRFIGPPDEELPREPVGAYEPAETAEIEERPKRLRISRRRMS